jgi:arginyl-tRNA--protein-N-Asp/Glu arginylyltransferase
MKILGHAPRKDFDVYIDREDTVWCEREPGDSLESLYNLGYLPYSGAQNINHVLYRGRSARVVLPQFELSSENRRIARKFDGQFSKEALSGAPGAEAIDFCLTYFAAKHGERAMPRERLMQIFKNVTNTMIYHSDSGPVAYVLEVTDGDMAHYWFSFYDLAYARQSLGLWLMLDSIRDAQARGLAHYYLGTVYGEKALYKTNYAPLQWWDGEHWSDDIRLLKSFV